MASDKIEMVGERGSQTAPREKEERWNKIVDGNGLGDEEGEEEEGGGKTRRNRGTNLSWRHVGSLIDRLGIRNEQQKKRTEKKGEGEKREKLRWEEKRQDYQAVLID